MQRSIIVTDLTRFKNPDIVCIAGVDLNNGECIRPMPYLTTATCRRLNVLPGAILRGDLSAWRHCQGPHQEDHRYSNLNCEGRCTSAEFQTALEYGLVDSVEQGFQTEMKDRQKCIPFGCTVRRSIITISISPRVVEIVEGAFEPGKIKLSFTDRSGRVFKFIAITDLGFHDYAINHHARKELSALNRWIRSQDGVLLRLGLSRRYRSPDGRDGYWLQANGVYTFPECREDIRGYS